MELLVVKFGLVLLWFPNFCLWSVWQVFGLKPAVLDLVLVVANGLSKGKLHAGTVGHFSSNKNQCYELTSPPN